MSESYLYSPAGVPVTRGGTHQDVEDVIIPEDFGNDRPIWLDWGQEKTLGTVSDCTYIQKDMDVSIK